MRCCHTNNDTCSRDDLWQWPLKALYLFQLTGSNSAITKVALPGVAGTQCCIAYSFRSLSLCLSLSCFRSLSLSGSYRRMWEVLAWSCIMSSHFPLSSAHSHVRSTWICIFISTHSCSINVPLLVSLVIFNCSCLTGCLEIKWFEA